MYYIYILDHEDKWNYIERVSTIDKFCERVQYYTQTMSRTCKVVFSSNRPEDTRKKSVM